MSFVRVPARAPVPDAAASERGTCVFTTIIGSEADADFHEKIHRLDHDHAVDHLRLPKADLSRRRLRAVTEGGREIAIALPREQQLFDGAVLEIGADHALLVRVEAETWLRLQAADHAAALKLGYFCGNLHWRVRFEQDDILIAVDIEERIYRERLAALVDAGDVKILGTGRDHHAHFHDGGAH